MKQMIFVHGDKGGCGKSTFATLLTDFMLNQGLPVALIEGDAMIRDVAPRFEDVANVNVVDVDLARSDMSEDAIVGLFSVLEQHLSDVETVVVNTPASGSATLDKQADIITRTLLELGFELVVAWMIGEDEASAKLASQSQLCKMAKAKIAVQNTRLKPVEALPWRKHPIRQEWLASGGKEIVLPGLTERVISKVREIQKPYSEIVRDRDNCLTIVERQSLKRWVETAWAEIAKMEDMNHE